MNNSVFISNIIYDNRLKNKVLFYLITISLSLIIALGYYIFDKTSYYAPVITQFITVTVALFGLGGFYRSKERLIKKYNSQTIAYRVAFFRYHVTFIPFVYMGALHSYLVTDFSQVILDISWVQFIRYIGALYLLLTGMILHTKSRKIFGLDNLFMYYVFHPEESRMVESIIHKIIRHPIYSAMNRIAWAGALFSGSWVSGILAGLFTINQIAWLALYEEPDLINRFGEGYISFKRRIPAMYPKYYQYCKFIKFLMGIEK